MTHTTHGAKIIIVGDPCSGKTCLAERYINNDFIEDSRMTIGVDYFSRTLSYFWKGQLVKMRLSIWDTAGQERFQSLAMNYYREANGAIIVFDLTDPESLCSVETYWLNQVRTHCQDMPIFLVGNKLESINSDGLRERAQTFAKANGLEYFETSAKTGQGVRNVFETMIAHLKTTTDKFKNVYGTLLCSDLNENSVPTVTKTTPKSAKKCCYLF